ncbi:MAG: sugar kinase [Desulfobulbaceae bacterium]|nr:sugar kinase [Desulfobulbaceae bacterium]
MLAVIGTIPDENMPLTVGAVAWRDGGLWLAERSCAVGRGTAALLAAASRAASVFPGVELCAVVAGDTGRGDGSRAIYAWLTEHLPHLSYSTLVFHYLQPDVDWHGRVLLAALAMAHKPVLIADAGFMYVAKMGGMADQYDFFTPDAGELAFLADEQAPHPFYTRGFLLRDGQSSPELIARAYQHGNAARYLLVKGAVDMLARDGQVIAQVEQPSFPAMEAIGGTGDTLTGVLAALCEAGLPPPKAALLAARCNRHCGDFPGLTPATQIGELIVRIPAVLRQIQMSDG